MNRYSFAICKLPVANYNNLIAWFESGCDPDIILISAADLNFAFHGNIVLVKKYIFAGFGFDNSIPWDHNGILSILLLDINICKHLRFQQFLFVVYFNFNGESPAGFIDAWADKGNLAFKKNLSQNTERYRCFRT